MKIALSLLLIFICCMIVIYSGCTQTTSPTVTEPGVQFYTQIEHSSVTPGITGNSGANQILSHGIVADSLQIQRVRILVRDVKMHGDRDDDAYPGHDIRVGPFLLTVESDSVKFSSYAPLPTGRYDHLKLEVHQFSSQEVSQFINDSTYGDFVTGERYSMIVDGTVYENGNAHPFSYRTAITLNLNLQLDSALDISSTTSAKLVLMVDPDVLFRIGFIVADPRDPNNKALIDNNIRFCFHALRHFL